VALMLAEQMKAAFIILLAGPGVTGEEILLEQIAAISRLAGEKEGTIKENLAVQKNIFTILKSETDNSKATTIIRQTLQAVREKKSAEEQKAMSDQIIDMQIKQLISPWYRYFLTYDPRPALKKVKCPVLALNGEKDAQVPPKQNLPEIEKALKAGGNSHYIVKELPGLNHLFQTCKTGAVSEYAQIEETVSPTALAMISDWLKQQVK
jgi:pimeloyl-ACP methyl ester carboxylesterase